MDKHEALTVIRKNYPHVASSGSQFETALRELIPDLKESEDERISRLIYCIIRDTPEVDDVLRANGRSVIEALAYLEKQKDLDKMIVVSPEVWDNAINDAYKNGKKNGEKQKEQKFTEKQDYSDLTDLERAIHRGFLVVGVENVPVTIIKETAQDCLAWMKPAEWSEEDKKIIEGMIVDYKGEIEHLSDSIIDEQVKPVYQERINFLNRLKTYCPESYNNDFQKKIEDAIYLIEHYSSHGHDKNLREKVINELKSLRPLQYCENCKLKRSVENWKPSKEQMGMLLAVINDPNNAGAESCHLMLRSLYADLKKL